MRGNLDRVMPHVFGHEGGYVDHKADPGGATNFGITFATLQDWRGRPITKADVRALTKDEAAWIYEKNYAKPIRFDDLPPGVDYAVLDYAINSGPRRAAEALQSIVGVKQDGKIGPDTLTAVSGRSPAGLVVALCDQRLAFLKRLRTWGTFGKGWSRRVNEVRAHALVLAQGTAPAPRPSGDPGVVPVPPVKPGMGATAGLGIGGALVALIWAIVEYFT